VPAESEETEEEDNIDEGTPVAYEENKDNRRASYISNTRIEIPLDHEWWRLVLYAIIAVSVAIAALIVSLPETARAIIENFLL